METAKGKDTDPDIQKTPSQDMVVRTESQSVLNMIAEAAKDPAVDVSKLEKLMDLQERFLDREAQKMFAEDFVKMKPNLPLVIKTHNNTQTKSKYAKLEDINKVVDPILSKFGFGTSTDIVAQDDKGVTVEAKLWHRGGHIETTKIFMPMDDVGMQGTKNKTMPHAVSSSTMYARRVAICAILQISTGDDNDGNLEPVYITQEQVEHVEKLIKETGADEKKFFEYMGVDSVAHIRANEIKKATSMLEAKKKNQAKNAGKAIS